jgi:hypothetical protein
MLLIKSKEELFIKVDLPDPLGPRSAYMPGVSSAVKLESALLLPYDLEML